MIRAYITFALGLAMLSAAVSGQEPSVFRSTSESVPVYVTVLDKNERLVTDLVRDDFEVRDNGRVQPITVFDNTPQPIRLIVMFDVSGSMAGNVATLRAASEELFSRLGPNDLVRIGTFGNAISITPTFTRDVEALRAAVPASIPESAATPLWAALDQAITELADVDGRPVILVLSDGRDSLRPVRGRGFVSQLEAIEHALAEEVMIYSIGLRSRGSRPMIGVGPANLGDMMAADLPDPGLGKAAIETGGGYFELRPRDDLGTLFGRVIEELHSQYLVGFAPSARDGKQHRIEVRMKDRDLKPRARKNYTAPKG